eukprot:GEMP01061661.1.p1 GENE.GEMP01061661.1~~GEMP01061661.1.p1  ORF type:complete len:356 (+),score=87.36 GEMP01061661.1:121-1188(+)
MSADRSDSDSDRGDNGGESLFTRIGGEAAVNSVVDELYDILQQDQRVAPYFAATDISKLIHHQKNFLTYAFGGVEEYSGQPIEEAHHELGITEVAFEAVVEDLGKVLESIGVGEELAQEVLQVVNGTKDEVMGNARKDGKSTSHGVTVIYDLENEHCDLVKRHLSWVVEAVGSLEEVGQAMYDSIFTNAGDAKVLFVSPKRATAFRFVLQVQRYVEGCDDIQYLDDELYNMSMRHIAYISPAQCKQYMPLFISSIITVIKGVLDEEWDDFGNEAWSKLLYYIGGMLIRNLGEFTGKVHLVRKSWATITNIKSFSSSKEMNQVDEEDEDDVAATAYIRIWLKPFLRQQKTSTLYWT